LSDWGNCVNQTSDGGFIIAGETQSYGAGITDVYLVRVNSKGDTVWTRTYGGIQSDCGNSVLQTSDGDFVTTGYIDKKVCLIRTNSNGVNTWTKLYSVRPVYTIQSGFSVLQANDDGFMITGEAVCFGPFLYDAFMIRTNTGGDTLWTKIYGGINSDCGNSVVKTNDGGFIVSGWTSSFSSGDKDVYAVHTNATGDTVWTKTYGKTVSDEEGNSVHQTNDGGFVFTGASNLKGIFNKDVYLIRTNAKGDTLWTKTYGGDSLDQGFCVDQTSDNGFIITGTTYSSGAGMDDIYLIRTNAGGETLWTKTVGGTNIDYSRFVQQTSDGGFIVVGTTASFGVGGTDIYLIRLSNEATGIRNLNTADCSGGAENVVFYDRNTHSITIRYTIKSFSSASIIAYDIQGRLIKTLIDKTLLKGSYTVNWDILQENSTPVGGGVYFFVIQANGHLYSKKITFVR
jgi:hypothetical protein